MSTPAATEVELTTDDGWSIGGLLRAADATAGPAPGVLLVPGSRHERDAYHATVDALAEAGMASLSIDIRGRGSSRGAVTYARMGPGQRRQVSRDVAAALDHLASAPEVDADRLALVAEQDTAADAVAAAGGDPRLRAVVLLSARHGPRLTEGLARRPVAVFGLASSEDRDGLRATVDAYLAGDETTSRLEVLRGLGFGVTMMSVRQFEHGDAEPLERMIARWLAARLSA